MFFLYILLILPSLCHPGSGSNPVCQCSHLGNHLQPPQLHLAVPKGRFDLEVDCADAPCPPKAPILAAPTLHKSPASPDLTMGVRRRRLELAWTLRPSLVYQSGGRGSTGQVAEIEPKPQLMAGVSSVTEALQLHGHFTDYIRVTNESK